MKHKKFICSIATLLAILGSSAKAHAVELEPITVQANTQQAQINTYSQPLTTQTSSEYTLTSSAIKTFSKANKSVFNAISMLPSVNAQGPDAYGNDETFNLRGIDSTKAGILNINGVPTPNGPTGSLTSGIFDLENIQSIKVYEGAIKPDVGFSSFGDFPGIIDLKIKNPSDKFGITYNQSFGSFDYSKNFIRIDSGDIKGFKTFISGSLTYGNKWKGSGTFVRKNVMFGLTKDFNNVVGLKLFMGYNSDFHNNYGFLNYKDALNVNNNYGEDYNNNPNSPLYYNYNTVNTRDYYILPTISINTTNNSTLELKPYFWSVRGDSYYTASNNQNVQKFLYNSNIFGIVSKYNWNFAKDYNLTVGYWFHKQQMPGPPYAIENYQVKNGSLAFNKWAILADHNYHTINSPFINLNGKIGKLTFDTGLKYLMYKTAAINGYNSVNNTNVDQALSLATPNPKEHADSKIFREYLPYVGLNYQLSDSLNIYANYGKTFEAPNFNLWPSYVSYLQAATKGFQTQNLQYFWDKYFNITTANNYDIGLRYNSEHLFFYPTLFYSRVNNIGTYILVNNGSTSSPIPLPINNATATSYGLEISAGYTPVKDLLLFVSYSYNRFYYTQNILYNDQIFDIKGQQVVNVPKNIVKCGITYKSDGFSVTPYISYIGRRYGQIAPFTQEIPSVTLVNLNLDYVLKKIWQFKEVDFSLNFTNLLNKRYISVINSPNANFGMFDQTTYQVGAPFTVVGSVSIKF